MEKKYTYSPPPISPERPSSLNSRQHAVFRCCTSDCDRHFLLFVVTFFLTMFVACFSMYMLVHVDKCDNDIYVSLLTMTLSVWFPTPSTARRNNV